MFSFGKKNTGVACYSGNCYISCLVRKWFPFIVALLVYAFTPGMCEIAEASAHFVTTGDIHFSDAEKHSEHGESHSEDNECHTCICHAPTAFLITTPVVEDSAVIPVSRELCLSPVNLFTEGALRELFRPPIS